MVACPGLLPLEFTAHGAIQWFVCASPVIDEPIVMGGPFVMNTRGLTPGGALDNARDLAAHAER